MFNWQHIRLATRDRQFVSFNKLFFNAIRGKKSPDRIPRKKFPWKMIPLKKVLKKNPGEKSSTGKKFSKTVKNRRSSTTFPKYFFPRDHFSTDRFSKDHFSLSLFFQGLLIRRFSFQETFFRGPFFRRLFSRIPDRRMFIIWSDPDLERNFHSSAHEDINFFQPTNCFSNQLRLKERRYIRLLGFWR